MIIKTKKTLQKCLPHAKPENIQKYGDKLIEAMTQYNIISNQRQAAFIAQIAHESGSLRYVEEIASGEAYEGRLDLGNKMPGDGKRFKGRGLIQITGRNNYKLVSDALNYDFIAKPEDLELPGPACFSAAWFWQLHRLNRLADIDAFEYVELEIEDEVMDRYIEIKEQIETLTAEADLIRLGIQVQLEADGINYASATNGKFTLSETKKWKYSDDLIDVAVKFAKQVKIAQAQEQKNKIATFTTTTSLKFSPNKTKYYDSKCISNQICS